MNKFTVVGAGMAGLFAASVLRDECDAVLEAQPTLPNNHSALLRFRSCVVGDALNIPFKKVNVVKTVETTGNPVRDAISYSVKTNGNATLRSLIKANGQIEERYIAPSDFIKRMKDKVQAEIRFDSQWQIKLTNNFAPMISTMPMPKLMEALGYDTYPDFRSAKGFSVVAKLRNTDLCATIYLPAEEEAAYRASITGDTLIIEFSEYGSAMALLEDMKRHPISLRSIIRSTLKKFGIPEFWLVGTPEIKEQKYAKILPIDDNDRKKFMLWATEKFGIYSFGRFATWRPDLLMDDLVKDLQVIQKLARGGTSYDARK